MFFQGTRLGDELNIEEGIKRGHVVLLKDKDHVKAEVDKFNESFEVLALPFKSCCTSWPLIWMRI